MIMQKKNLMIVKIASYQGPGHCQDNKVLDQNFVFRFQHWLSLFLSAVVHQFCVFSFSLLPCTSQLIFPAGNFHAITRCFVLIQDELHGFTGEC